jgi:hypothetical protein
MVKKNANDLLFGDRIPAAKFPAVGAEISGTILDLGSRQRRDYDPNKPGSQGNPMWWQDGKPVALASDVARRMELTEDDMVIDPVITLKTDLGDGKADDGRRNLFVNSELLRNALRGAVEPGEKFALGGRLHVKHTGMGEPKKKGSRAPKAYEATYSAPTPEEVAAAKAQAAPDDPWA